MENQIFDATSSGIGQGAKVDGNRLWTDAVVKTLVEELALTGSGFIVNTGIVNLTTANKSAIFYLKNNSLFTLILSDIRVDLGLSAGTGDLMSEVILNPTTGTIVDNATAVSVLKNKNALSPNGFTAAQLSAFQGLEGYTITDGSQWDLDILPKSSEKAVITTDQLILPPLSSIGINLTPQTGNVDMDVIISLSLTRKIVL